MEDDIGAMLAAAFAAPASTGTPTERLRFPLERTDIAQIWLDCRWEWAVLRTPSKGRPRQLPTGRWIESGTFVPWGRLAPIRDTGTWASLALGRREPNSLQDALNALEELNAPRMARKPLKITNPFALPRRRGPRRLWDAEAYAELLIAVEENRGNTQSVQAIFRRLAKSKNFGNVSPLTLRRRYFDALLRIAHLDADRRIDAEAIS